MNRRIALAAGVCALLTTAIAAGFAGYKIGQDSVVPLSPSRYPEGRAFFTRMNAELTGDVDTLVVGDSLVEQNDFTGTCGKTFTAGMGGARTTEPLSVLPQLLADLEPETVVVALGTNYFTSGDEYDNFTEDYAEFVSALGDRKLIFVGIANSERGNAFIRNFAERKGHAFVDPPEGPFFQDGIHYSREGSIAFRQAIADKCAEIR